MNPTADQLRARGIGEATIRRTMAAQFQPTPMNPFPPKRIRQSAKPLLNKLETEWRDYLVRQLPGVTIHEQALRFRLANGLRYTPDLAAFFEGALMCWEVKGPFAHRGGFENLKMAATVYPDIEWTLCWKANGEWQTQKVLP